MLRGKGMKTDILFHLYDILERQNQRDRNQIINYQELRMEEKDSLQSVITFWKKWKLYLGFVGGMQFKTLCTEYPKKLNFTKCKLYLEKPEYNFSQSSIFCTIIFTEKKKSAYITSYQFFTTKGLIFPRKCQNPTINSQLLWRC